MALTELRNGPESSRLLGAKIASDNHKEQHGNSVVTNNEDTGGKGEPTVVIEMVPPPVSTPLTQPPNPELTNNTERHDSKEDEEEEENNSDAEGDNIFDENCCTRRVEKYQEAVHLCLQPKKSLILTVLKVTLLLLYFGYFCYCMSRGLNDEGSYRLLLFTVVGFLILAKKKIPFRCHRFSLVNLTALWGGSRRARRVRFVAKLVLTLGVVIFMVVFVVVNVAKENEENLQSLIGLIGFIIILFLVSKNPAKVNWHTVLWGIAIQWVLAVIILRTHWGLVLFEWVGDRVSEFLEFALTGAEFVFGKDYFRHRLAMLTVSIMLFFNSVIHLLFHLGAIQAVINSFGRFLAFCLDTNPIESFAASSNIFISLTEAPMLLRPFLKHMTKSELHTVMTCGFASISGSVLGTYVTFNIQANHLLTASVMSAPAALAISKLMCPETERSRLKDVKSDKIGTM
ncbi:hypothetical protein V1264_014401 [Littorina saxatilis]|uniref:Solute carrier family 28 member 3 n=2 Tax=Littorina saxatilis TaxID=31220 RepID=A0AAN9BSV6_9CAEN